MSTINKHSLNSSTKICLGKDSHFRSQKEIFFNFLKEHTSTASMVSKATGIPQKNICRYKRDLERIDKLWVVKIGKCEDTGCDACFLTTNPALAPFKSQLSLFDY